MIIRSQDKKSIINFNEIDTIKCKVIKEVGVFKPFYETEIRYFKDGEYYGLLGIYSTEEKAIKVLDMIQQEFLKYGTIESGYGVESVYVIPKCFQMPQDSEV